MIRVGVVGASGYLGRSLFSDLAGEDGCRVTAFDLERHPSIPVGSFRRIDVRRPGSLEGAFEGMDSVVYRAGLKGPAASFARPVAFQEVNVQGVLHVVEECLRAGVEQLVYDSTESVFGPADEPPFTEDQLPHPNTVYGATKRAAEGYLFRLSADGELATVVLRYPRVVGGDGVSVITRLADTIAARETVEITASGAKRFDLVHLQDVLRWNRWCIRHAGWSGLLHLSCGEAFTAPEVAQAVAEELSRPLRQQITERRSRNDTLLPDHMELDTTKSREETGLDVGLTRLEELVRAVLAERQGTAG